MLLLLGFSFLPIFFISFWFAAIGFLIWNKSQAEIDRSIYMKSLAQVLGLAFSAKDSFGLARQLQGFDLFRRERSHWLNNGKVTNVMRGLVGETEVFMFDYSYRVQAGNTPKKVSQTVFFANDKNWFLPNFQLKPEKWWHKLQTKLGLNTDINFEENIAFSEKFWLKSKFEELVRQQFTPDLQGFLTEKPPAHLEGNNYYLIAYKPRVKMYPVEAKEFFKHCCEVVQLLQQKGNLELLDLAELKKEAVVVPTTLPLS